MKKTLILFTVLFYFIINVNCQSANTFDNYFTYHDYMMDYFQSQAIQQNILYTEVDGWKEFCKWKMETMHRHDEFGNFTPYAEALDDYYNNFQDNELTDLPQWEYYGHDGLYPQFGGPITTCYVGQGNINRIWVNKNDLNHILAGGNHGSLWLTTDGGDNWACISDSEPLMDGHASIEVDPTNTNKIYVAQRFKAISNGLFYTTDAGISWTNNKVFVDDNNINENFYPTGDLKKIPVKWIINPNNTQIVYLLTYGYLLRSIDGGTNWDIILDKDYSLDHGKRFTDIEFDPSDPSVFYVAGPEVFKFTNNGNNEVNITSSILESLHPKNTVAIGTQSQFNNYIWFTVYAFEDTYYDRKIYVKRLNTSTSTYATLATTLDVAHNDYDKIQCEISPVLDANGKHVIMVGKIDAHLCRANNLGTYQYKDISECETSTNNWTHHDVRDAKFLEDGNGNEVLLVGNDGGVFSAITSSPDEWNWTYLANDGTNGIRNADILGFDCSNTTTKKLYAGFMDMHAGIKTGNQWNEIFSKDGSTGIIDKTNPNNIYGSYMSGGNANFRRTTDGGNNFDYNMFLVNILQPPIIFKPGDNDCFYVGDNQKLRKFDNVWSSPIDDDEILTIPDDNPTIDYFGDLRVRELAVCESNPNVIYASTQRYFPEIVTYAKAIYKTTNGGQSWTDISANLINGLQYGSITGLAINPNNQNEIWACFGGVASSTNANLAKKVYHSVNAGVSWVPMATGLHEKIPAKDIFYDQVSDRLYLATDVGLYFCNSNEGIWYNFSNGLPPTNVDMIRCNYALNKIRVATKGRGIWQAELPCYSNDNTITINSNETWDTEEHKYSDIVVETGATLTITDKLHMPADRKIVVERGAKLVLDGGTITNSYCGPWQGIQVHGNAAQSQSYSYQGAVEIINGGTIENAICGIETIKYYTTGTPNLNYTGGMVLINDGVFKNNETAIKFWPYSSATSASFAGNCRFITDENCLLEIEPDYFVELNDISGVRFISSSFTDSRTGILLMDRTSGINSYDSYINVYSACDFTDLYYGIYATASTTAKNVKITNSDFDRNYRGIYIGGITDPHITSNDFYMENMSTTNCYGLYLDESTDYWIEGNMFQGVTTDGTPKGTGIIVNESGGDPNEIYLNEFNDTEYSIKVQGSNRDGSNGDIGLVIKCNEYYDTKFDETILWKGPRIPNTAGIAGQQGVEFSTLIEDMAGNIFHYPTPTPDGDYDDLDNEANSFDYYYSNNAGIAKVEPKDAQLNVTVFAIPVGTSPWSHEAACEPTGSGGGGGTGDDREKMGAAQTEIEATEAILTALVDGGDTEALNTEVETSTPLETIQVYNELMAESPNLSETVVESTIEKEEVLPNAMVRDVMVANPHTAKSIVLLDKLDERYDPMPEYMKAQILAGKSIQTLKQELEAELAKHQMDKAKAMNNIIRYYKEEETDPTVAYTELVNLFQEDNTIKSSYRLAWLYLEKGEYQLGSGVISNIPVQFNLTDEQQLVYDGMADIYTLLSGLYQNGNTLEELNETQVSQLQNLASGEVLTIRAYARNILMAIDEVEYEEPILFPDHFKSAQAIEEYNELMQAEQPQMLNVYPNPSIGYVILEYNMETEVDAVLEIKDVNGKTIRTINTSQKQDQVTVTTEDWRPGLYIATLKINGKSIESVKFTLVK